MMAWTAKLRYVIFGLLAYVVFLVLQFPAERAYGLWKSGPGAAQPVVLGELSGSVWSGAANVAVIGGQRLEALHWSLHPWRMLLGKLALDWGLKVPDGYATGELAADPGGGLALQRLEARLPLDQLSGIKALAALRPSGAVNLNLRDVQWDGKTLASADGRLVWSGAGINLFQPLEFGDLSLTLETGAEGVSGVLSDAGGPLQAEGLLSLKADGSYQFSGAFAVRGDGHAPLQQALRSMGRPGADGKVRVNYSGQLAALGLARR